MILRPNGTPSKRNVEQLSRAEVKRILEFEAWLTSRGLQIDIYCKKCIDTYGSLKGGRCWGNNARDGAQWHLECQCTDRAYGTGIVERKAATAGDPKIMVTV